MEATGGDFAGTERFKVLRQIGKGGMGVVFEVEDRSSGANVALKTLPSMNPWSLYRFKREFRSLADLSHPNLVTLYELFANDNQWFFTMELVDGVNFVDHALGRLSDTLASESTVLAHLDTSSETASQLNTFPNEATAVAAAVPAAARKVKAGPRCTNFQLARHLLRQLGTGLCALHAAGWIHGDIKPSNVLVTPGRRTVLLDFGLARELGGMNKGEVEEGVAGTIGYLAPELLTGSKPSEAADWYSVGVMLYLLLTGLMPSRSGSPPSRPSDIVAGLPEDLDHLCGDLLLRAPELRPSGRDVLSRLSEGRLSAPSALVAVRGREVFIGRETQLRSLESAFARVASGNFQAVFVHGIPGIGKTSLIQHFLRKLSNREGTIVLAGRCYERESVPYKGFDSIVDALSRYLRTLSVADASVLMPRHVSALAQIFPVLQRVEAVAKAPKRTDGVVEDYEFRRIAFAALRELLSRLGDRVRLVIFIDDLQWGDVDSAALLQEILSPPDSPPLLLVCSYRTEDFSTSSCLRALYQSGHEPFPGQITLNVEPLTEIESRNLAEALLGKRGAGSVVDTLARESQGSPYFVHALTEGVENEGDAFGTVEVVKNVTLESVLWTRISGLPEDSRHFLETLAVFGKPMRQLDAYTSARIQQRDPLKMSRLRAGHFIRMTGEEESNVEIYHDRIRETILTNLSQDVRRDYHWKLATTLEQSASDDPETLAVHFEAAGILDKGNKYLHAAAEKASQALAFSHAADLYRRILNLRFVQGDQLRNVKVQLANALVNAGQVVEAAGMYEQTADESKNDELSREMNRLAAFHFYSSGHVEEGRARFRKVLEAASMRMPAGSAETMASILFYRTILWFRGLEFHTTNEDEIPWDVLNRIDAAWAAGAGMSFTDSSLGWLFTSRALLLAFQAGEPSRVARSLSWEAAAVGSMSVKGQRLGDELLSICQNVVDSIALPQAKGMLELAKGLAANHRGQWQDSLECLNKAEDIFSRCIGVPWERQVTGEFQLRCLLYLGEYRQLRIRARELMKWGQETGNLLLIMWCGMNASSYLDLITNRPADALQSVEIALKRWTPPGVHLLHTAEAEVRSWIHLYSGTAIEGLNELSRTWIVLRKNQFLRPITVRVNLVNMRARLAVAAARLGDMKSLKLAEKDAHALEQEGLPWVLPLASIIRAGIANVRGDKPGAIARLKEAEQGLVRFNMRGSLHAVRRTLGTLIPDERGAVLIDAAEASLRKETVENPERWSNVIVPGFEVRP